jgi:hypothetical protein
LAKKKTIDEYILELESGSDKKRLTALKTLFQFTLDKWEFLLRIIDDVGRHTDHVKHRPQVRPLLWAVFEHPENYNSIISNTDPKFRHLVRDVYELRKSLKPILACVEPNIIYLLKDASWKIRSWAVRLLGELGRAGIVDEIAIPHLAMALEDKTATVRDSAASALGYMGKKAASVIPDLERTLHDSNRSVRTSAHMALRNIREIADSLNKDIGNDYRLTCTEINDDVLDIHYSYYYKKFSRSTNNDNSEPYDGNYIVVQKYYYESIDWEYCIIEREGKYGLLSYRAKPSYPKKIILEPYFTSLALSNHNIDLDELIGTEQAWEKLWGRAIYEYNYLIVEADGKFGLLHKDQIIIGLNYDLIIKLTFRHYLCKKHKSYDLFAFTYEGDTETSGRLVTISVEDKITPEKLLTILSDVSPQAYTEITKLFYLDTNKKVYISEYRFYEEWAVGHSVWWTAAIQRVEMDDDFQIRPLDIMGPYVHVNTVSAN